MQFGRCNWRCSAFFCSVYSSSLSILLLYHLLLRLLCALVLLLSHQRVTVAELLRGRNARKKPCTQAGQTWRGALEALPALSVSSACALMQLQSHCLLCCCDCASATVKLQSHWQHCLRLCKAVLPASLFCLRRSSIVLPAVKWL